MEYITDSPYVTEEWRTINEGAARDFEGLEHSQCPNLWQEIERSLMEAGI
jgi:hypothetical protein